VKTALQEAFNFENRVMFNVKALPGRFHANRELCKTLIALLFWMGFLLSIAYNKWFIEVVVDRLALALSGLIGAVLELAGNEIIRVGTIIKSNGFSMNIYYKCTGVYQTAGFVAGVLAYPTAFRAKVVGVVWGSLVIGFINVFRLVSIFYIGLYIPEWVAFSHSVIWEALMILSTILVWRLWARRANAEH